FDKPYAASTHNQEGNTMKKIVPAFLLACTAFALPMGASMAQDAKLAPIFDYLKSDLKPWLNDPAII
ncbi:hypothetical protein ACC706_37415, partial [Rhizobium johnstonii]